MDDIHAWPSDTMRSSYAWPREKGVGEPEAVATSSNDAQIEIIVGEP